MAGLMPGEWNWMSRDPFLRGPGGFGAPTDSPGGILGQPQQGGIRGLLGDPSFALSLLAASGPSPEPRSFGQILGQSALQSMGAQQQRQDTDLRKRYMQAQIEQMQRPDKPAPTPTSIQEFEYAKKNGYPGSYQEWVASGGGSSNETADIQNWKFYQNLTPEQRKEWTSLQRQPTVPQLATINGVSTLVDRLNQTVTPLTTLQAEAAAKSQLEETSAVGKARGEARGGLEKKGVAASNLLSKLDLADPLIDAATGSVTGAAADKVAAFFGKSLDGAQATAQLKILQADLMTNMPRMEGPQSDRDVQLYREAAGELGDPMVPRAQKKAAVQMIRALQQKYAQGMTIYPNGSPEAKQADSARIKSLLDKYAP